MQLAHALDDGLAEFVVHRDAEGRVLLRQAIERDAELLLIALGLGLDRHLDHGIGEFHALENDRLGRIAQRIARGHVLEAGHGNDVAGISLLDVLAVIGVHQQHAADALFPVLHRVEQRRAGLDLARINATEGERTDEGIVHDLEGEHGERRIVLRLARHLLARFDVDALHRRHVERRRQIIHHGVEHGLHALVLERRAAQDRHEDVGHRCLCE